MLNACSHGGLVDEAMEILKIAKQSSQITPQHYACVVDVLGRDGRLQDAEEMLLSTPQIDIVSWMTLLGACRAHKDLPRAERVFNDIVARDKTSVPAYVLAANI